MSTIIQIKRSSGSSAPSTSDLLEGELAYAEDASNNGAGAKLYIESVNSTGGAVIEAIGGKFYTSAVDSATNSNTASTIVKRDGSGNFSAGTITAALTGNVTGNVTGTVSSLSNHDTDDLSEGASNRYFTDGRARDAISVSGDLSYNSSTGVISYTSSLAAFDTGDLAEGSNLYFTNSRARDAISVSGDLSYNSSTGVISYTAASVSLASFDTGDLAEGSNLYFTNSRARDAISASGDISYDPSTGVISYTSSLASFDTDDLAEGSNLYFTTARVESAVDNYVSGGTGLTYNSGTIDLDDTAVSAGSYGSGSAIPTFTVDAQGRLTAAGEVSVSTSLGVLGDSGSASIDLLNEDLTIAGGTGVVTSVSGNSVTVAIGQDVSTTANVTFNDVTVDGTLNSDDITATNITVAGNLTVTGTTTTVNSTTISVTDPLVFVGNDNNSTDAVDLGLFGMYDNGGTDKYAGIFRDATDGKFKLFKDLQTAPTTTVNTSGTGYTVATLLANLEGSLTGGTVSGLSAAIAVADGGTGATTLTAKGVLFGNGTGAIGATSVGTAGQVLLSNGSGNAPSFGNIDGGTY